MAALEASLKTTDLSPDQVKEVIEKIEKFIEDSKKILCKTLPAIPSNYELKLGKYTLSVGPGFISAMEEISEECILQYTITRCAPSPTSEE